MSLADAIALGDDNAVGTLHGATHIGFQLSAMHLAILMDGVDFAIVVEEDAEVVDITFHVMVLPRSFNLLAGIALQSLAIDIGKDIEHAIGIADTGSPNALAVDLLMILQGKLIIGEVEAIEAVADVLPVDQILGMKDDKTGHSVHRGASQIIVIAHTEDVGVAEFIIEQGIRKRAVTIVGGPRGGLCRSVQCGASQEASAP